MPVQQHQEQRHAVSILDDLIPLQDASHTDVVEYSVEIRLRYAECRAILNDGRSIGLAEPRQFLGWSSHDPSRTLLFRVNESHLELTVEEELAGKAPGRVHNITLEAVALKCADGMRKFIGIDGSQVLLPA